MLDEREGEVSKEEKHRAFNNKSILERAAIIIAGPLVNLIFAVLVYIIIFVSGTIGIKPVVGNVIANSLAEKSGITKGDQFISVNSYKTTTIEQVFNRLLENSNQSFLPLQLLSEKGIIKNVNIKIPNDLLDKPNENFMQKLGFNFAYPSFKPIIGKVFNNTPAQKSGFKKGDIVIKTNNKKINSWQQWVGIIKKNPNKILFVVIKRK